MVLYTDGTEVVLHFPGIRISLTVEETDPVMAAFQAGTLFESRMGEFADAYFRSIQNRVPLWPEHVSVRDVTDHSVQINEVPAPIEEPPVVTEEVPEVIDDKTSEPVPNWAPKASSEHHPRGNRKLEEHDVAIIKMRLCAGETPVEIAKDYALTVSLACIKDIDRNKTWRWVKPLPAIKATEIRHVEAKMPPRANNLNAFA